MVVKWRHKVGQAKQIIYIYGSIRYINSIKYLAVERSRCLTESTEQPRGAEKRPVARWINRLEKATLDSKGSHWILIRPDIWRKLNCRISEGLKITNYRMCGAPESLSTRGMVLIGTCKLKIACPWWVASNDADGMNDKVLNDRRERPGHCAIAQGAYAVCRCRLETRRIGPWQWTVGDTQSDHTHFISFDFPFAIILLQPQPHFLPCSERPSQNIPFLCLGEREALKGRPKSTARLPNQLVKGLLSGLFWRTWPWLSELPKCLVTSCPYFKFFNSSSPCRLQIQRTWRKCKHV